MQQKSHFKLLILSPIFYVIALYLSALPHEFSHSFMAWILGIKYNPLLIDWGGKSLLNLLLLVNVDEHVNYFHAYLLGYRNFISLIAFAGPGIGTFSLFVFSFYLLQNKIVKNNNYLYFFIFLVNIINLGEIFAYVPIRALSSHADIGNINFGLNISPWWIFIFIGYLVLYALYTFYKVTLKNAYENLNLTSTVKKLVLLVFSTLYIFGFDARVGLTGYGEITYLLSILSILSIPCILFLNWPKK